MKVAVLSESPADEAAIRIMVDRLLGQETHPVGLPPLRSRGWPSVREILPSVYKALYYRTDADGIVVVVDSNHSPLHEAAHEGSARADRSCRQCELGSAIARVRGQLRSIPGRPPLKVAIGMAVPAIEAWYRCGIDPQVSEAAWSRGLQSGDFPFTKNRLKQMVYGTDRPGIALETSRATAAAHRLLHALPQLEALFPNGFGSLARTLREWR